MKTRLLAFALLGLTLPLLPACKSQNATVITPLEDVDKKVEGWGLRKLTPDQYPDMRAAFMDRAGLEQAVAKSIQYLSAASSQHAYPSGLPDDTITHDQVLASLLDFQNLLHTLRSGDEFQQQLLTRYDVYESKGFDDKGGVWFTGYFTPIFYGSRTPTAEFKYPVYRSPPDLARNPVTGEILGRRLPNGTYAPYPTRKELMANDGAALHGLELFYFRDPMEAYIVQVQGSAMVLSPDGRSDTSIGYDGKNGRDYRGLGSELVKDGKIDKKHLSLPAVLEYFQQHPTEREEYMMRNDSFAFLKEYAVTEWPSGSLGVKVTAQRSLATDKKIFPRASLTFVAVDKASADESATKPYTGFLLDQDTGGAIQAAGRADIYMGIGSEAGAQAGRQFSQGQLYYIFLKPEFINTINNPALRRAAPPLGAPRTGAGPGGSSARPLPSGTPQQ